MHFQDIIVTNVLDSGISFGATICSRPESIFIPKGVSRATSVVVGQRVRAVLVPNTLQPDRTPWLAVRVDTNCTNENNVIDLISRGGEWTASDVASSLSIDRSGCAVTLENIYLSGRCSKYQLWRGGDRPSETWYTVNPEEVEFVTVEED